MLKRMLSFLLLLLLCSIGTKIYAGCPGTYEEIGCGYCSPPKNEEGCFGKCDPGYIYPVHFEGICLKGHPDGEWVGKDETGRILGKEQWVKGILNGEFVRWYKNGTKRVEGNYENGKKTGQWSLWIEESNVLQKTDYNKDGKPIKTVSWNKANEAIEEKFYNQYGQEEKLIVYNNKEHSDYTEHVYNNELGTVRSRIYKDGKLQKETVHGLMKE